MSTPEANVEAGLDRIDRERTVEMPLVDALYVFNTLGELIRFFHQPEHWKTLEDVQRFVGDRDSGGLRILFEAYYTRMRHVWPDDVHEMFDEGAFDLPTKRGESAD